MSERVSITEAAKAVVDELRQQHEALIFHQSGGCCDGSAPMCLAADDLMLNENDIYLGTIHGCPFFMAADQFNYWKYTHLTIDVTSGRGASFSLEIPMGVRFITKSRLMSETEYNLLPPVKTALDYQ